MAAAIAVLALAFYPPFFPQHIRGRRFDIELAAVTLATLGLLLALRGLPKLSLHGKLPNVSLASAGWKRLWIVLSLIYLATVIGFAWHHYPSSPSEDARHAAETRVPKPDPWGYLTKGPESSAETDSRATAIYNEALREYHAREQRMFLIQAALWWVSPVAAVYLLSIAVCWVYRGFQQETGA